MGHVSKGFGVWRECNYVLVSTSNFGSSSNHQATIMQKKPSEGGTKNTIKCKWKDMIVLL